MTCRAYGIVPQILSGIYIAAEGRPPYTRIIGIVDWGEEVKISPAV